MSPADPTQLVLAPVAATTLAPAESAPGILVKAIQADPDALVYFLLNVGDGDTQCLLLPPDSNTGERRLVIVDVATANKLPRLLSALQKAGVINQPLVSPQQIRLLVATHPHSDHIGGIVNLLDHFNNANGCIDQFWDPGYFFPGPTFHNLMAELETSPWIRRLQPTSGTSLTLDSVKITVIGPGIGLRTRFDTYGVEINDSSITLMIDYPAARVFAEDADKDPGRKNRRAVGIRSRRLLLGADAQFTSWAQATVDFPDLQQEHNAILAKELRAATGRDYLRADIFKMSHHASKHGVTLELMERVGAKYVFVSSLSGGGSYNFPHALAMDAAREARQPTTSNNAPRLTDHELGIHATGGVLDDASSTPLGTIVALIPRRPSQKIRIFRMMDRPRENIDMLSAREVVT